MLESRVAREASCLLEESETLTNPEPDPLGAPQDKSHDHVQYSLVPERTYHALTQTSKQVRSETIPIFYGNNTFEISISTRKQIYPFRRLIRADKYVATWALAACEKAIGSIRSLILSFDSLSKYGLHADYFEQSSDASEWFQHMTTPCEASEGSTLVIDLVDGTVQDLGTERGAQRNDRCKDYENHAQTWLNGMTIVAGKRMLTRKKLLRLVW